MVLSASSSTLRLRNRTASSPQRSASRTTVWRAERVQGGQRFWVPNLEEKNTLNISVDISTTAQSLTQPTPPKETVQISVELSLPPAHSTCTIRSTEYNGFILPQGRSRDSDRAEYLLQNGQVLAAGIKFVTQGSDSSVFILRVAVLPRSLRPEPMDVNTILRLNTADRLESWLQYGQPPGLGVSTRGIYVRP